MWFFSSEVIRTAMDFRRKSASENSMATTFLLCSFRLGFEPVAGTYVGEWRARPVLAGVVFASLDVLVKEVAASALSARGRFWQFSFHGSWNSLKFTVGKSYPKTSRGELLA